MGDRRFPQHAHGAAATIAYRASPSPCLCGYFWGEPPRTPLLGTWVNSPSEVGADLVQDVPTPEGHDEAQDHPVDPASEDGRSYEGTDREHDAPYYQRTDRQEQPDAAHHDAL